jgi:hypothetical protein
MVSRRQGGASTPLWVRWLQAWAFIFAIAAVWCVTTPYPSGPDEPAQIVKAAAVDRGTLTGRPATPGSVYQYVPVPETYAAMETRNQACVYTSDVTTGGCIKSRVDSGRTVQAITYLARYPPLYYAAAGWPTLLSTSPGSVLYVRLAGALVTSLFVGLALAVAINYGRSKLLLLGVAVAVTPEITYLASVVNPNGLEITAALATWTAATAVVTETDGAPDGGLLAALVVSAVALGLTRPLSPVWAVAAIVGPALFRPSAARACLRLRRVRIALGIIVAGLAVAVGYILAVHGLAEEAFPLPPGTPTRAIAAMVVGLLGAWNSQMVGSFGAPDTAAPYLAVVIWGGALAALVGAALLVGRRAEAVGLAALVVMTMWVVPVAATYSHARGSGITWQGRYSYPLVAGVPVVAGALLGRYRQTIGRVAVLVPAALATGFAISQLWVLRRYTIGEVPGAVLLPHGPADWRSIHTTLVVAALGVVTACAYGVWLHRMSRDEPQPSIRAHRRSALGEPAAVTPE